MSSEETTYFFSYARADADFVLKLAKELRAAGANLWLDQLDILGGERWDRAVEKALMACQSMIVVLSPESVNSPNVMDEVSYALEERKLVVPILYKECSIPFRLRRVQRIDFIADYDAGFADLLRALRIEQPEPTPAPAVVEPPIAETPTVYPDFIPLDDPYPAFDPSVPPTERYARYRIRIPIEGRPDLTVGEIYRVRKGVAEPLVARGRLGRVKRGENTAPSQKQLLITTKQPKPEKQVAQTEEAPAEEKLPETTQTSRIPQPVSFNKDSKSVPFWMVFWVLLGATFGGTIGAILGGIGGMIFGAIAVALVSLSFSAFY